MAAYLQGRGSTASAPGARQIARPRAVPWPNLKIKGVDHRRDLRRGLPHGRHADHHHRADAEWALIAARTMTGFATSVIACGAEAGIERAGSRRRDAGRPARRRRAAVHHGRQQAADSAPQPRRPMRADEPGLGLLRRARRREEAEARLLAPLLRRRLADVEADRRPAILAHPGDGRRVRLRGRRPASPRRRSAAAICSCSAARIAPCSRPASAR